MSASVIQCTNEQEEAGTIMKSSIDTVIVEQLAQAQISDPAYHAMLKALVAKVALERNKTIGFSGSQGSGKSTLVSVLKAVLEQAQGLRVASLSLDDFYKTRSARTQMMREHPMFQVRGVPGTHDIDLMQQAKLALCAGRAAQVPVFDKGLDDRAGTMTIPAGCEKVLLEGWCFGATPEPALDLATPVNALEAEQDPQGLWRHGVNEYLAGQAYQQLFTVDYWVYFKAPNFEAILDWRAEQEARFNQGPKAMTRSEIEAFIGYYQRITQWMLLDAPGRADLVVTLNPDHSIAAVQGDLEFSFGSSLSS
ncbi:hypothetical protein N9H70_02550 [Pseudomonadales bacterium]|nr:hypothetical protein [Pseudomonadales bacterium]